MSDYGYDSDEYDGFDDGWLYIAEEDHPADDLAERAVASPPVRDYDLDGSGYNSDYFEYWVDIEYNSDGWNDTKGPSKTGVSTKTTPGPKKRKRVAQGGPSQKKRRGAHGRQLVDAESKDKVPPVLWQSSKERLKQQFEGPRPMPEEPQSFSLLGDWRTRFGPEAGKSKGKKASVEHKVAPDATDQILKAVEMDSAVPEEEEWEDEEGTAQQDGNGLENLISGDGLDPEALQRALEENLAASGAAPAGLDKSKLLASLLRMVNGEGEAEDIAGELAEDLFEQAEEEDPEGKNIAAWAARQKGDPENGDEQGAGTAPEEASVPVPEAKSKATLPTPPTNEASSTEEKGKRNGAKVTTSVSVAGGLRSRKRKAAEPEPDEEPLPRPKRATRSYAAPTTSSKSKTTGAKGDKSKRG